MRLIIVSWLCRQGIVFRRYMLNKILRSEMDIWEKRFPGRRNSKFKGPEVAT